MKKFGSIEQFRNVIREVRTNHDYAGKDENGNPTYQHSTPYPTIRFTGTTKVHGTSAAMCRYLDGRTTFQSRERELSLEFDNAGFMRHFHDWNLDWIFDQFQYNDYCAVYGEWCGKGIQSGVAVSQLSKRFIVFAVKCDDEWANIQSFTGNDVDVFNIRQFTNWSIDINFNEPEMSQNLLIEWTLQVEDECPVGKYFDVIGTGEGIVFSGTHNGKFYSFKSKGEKHSVSRVKTLNAVDVESLNSLKEFVEYACTENRLQQGLTYLKENGYEVSQKSTGDFLRWIVNDIHKEESDTITANGLDTKKLNPLISSTARQWFFKNF